MDDAERAPAARGPVSGDCERVGLTRRDTGRLVHRSRDRLIRRRRRNFGRWNGRRSDRSRRFQRRAIVPLGRHLRQLGIVLNGLSPRRIEYYSNYRYYRSYKKYYGAQT